MSTSSPSTPISSSAATPAAVPRWLWGLALAVGVLRCLPWLASYGLDAPEGSSLLHMGFIPKDLLQYLSFAQQAADGGGLFGANPFTTEAQDGRFLLPLFSLLGVLGGSLGGSLIAWIELARIPLLLVFVAVLWRFLEPFIEQARERALVVVLIALSGGIEVFAKQWIPLLPAEAGAELRQATWQMSGWTTFAASYNPLWIAGGAGVLAWLRPIFQPGKALSPAAQLGSALGLFALFALHPYSAITAATAAVFALAVGWLVGERSVARGLVPALGAAALGIALLGAWQRADAVFAASSGAALGSQQLSPFWYPLVYGSLCIFALRGARTWVSGEHPLRFALLGWLLAAVWLHTSTLLNGYHFAGALHIPLCILAAPAFVESWDRARSGKPCAIVLCAATLLAPVWLSAESVAQVAEDNAVPVEFAAIVKDLKPLEPGNILTGERLGNVLPAYTPHRVFLGHHFLTPDRAGRGKKVRDLMAGALDAATIGELILEHRLRYAVLPAQRGHKGLEALAPWTTERREIGRYTVLELQAEPR